MPMRPTSKAMCFCARSFRLRASSDSAGPASEDTWTARTLPSAVMSRMGWSTRHWLLEECSIGGRSPPIERQSWASRGYRWANLPTMRPVGLDRHTSTSQPEDGYTVTSPTLPELITEGETIEEALAHVQ